MPEAESSAAPVMGTATPHPAADAATLPAKRGGEQFFYGGQAVIEGVMMRGKRHYAVAVHRSSNFTFVVVEGLIRVGLVLGYLSVIALLPDVRRVFQYHGAEHKTINAFESGWPLEVPSVRRASLLHPRCGTGFLLVVLVVSVVVFSVVALFHPNWFWLIASRVLAIPLIAGAGFELIRSMARHRTNPLVKVLLLPVLGTQKFTTREPRDDMLEVPIVAFNSAREGEEDTAGAAA